MPSDPNSIVDYLREHGQDASFTGRKAIWQLLFPAENYQGSAEQNLRLLNLFRTSELTPTIQLTKSQVPLNSELEAIVGGISPVGIECSLNQMSFQAAPGQTIILGIVDRSGFFPLHVFIDSQGTSGEIVVLPSLVPGHVDVALWTVPYKFDDVTIPVVVTADERDVVERFTDFIFSTEDYASNAAAEAGVDFFKPENWLGLGLDVFIGVGISIVTTPGGGAIYYLQMGADWGIEFLATWLEKLIDNLPLGSFSSDDKDMLKARLLGSFRVAQLAFGGFDTFTKSNRIAKVCSALPLMGSVPGWTTQVFDIQPNAEGPKMAGKLFMDSVSKSITMVCKLTQNDN
ncbi:MAG: hypothetical protein KDB00_01590 [Planctomycetales bacterium]|nr:hypothetical protein [Planctomycetales bacterium]